MKNSLYYALASVSFVSVAVYFLSLIVTARGVRDVALELWFRTASRAGRIAARSAIE